MKKQILSVFLVLMFILAGCGGDKPVVSKPTTPDYTDSSNSNSDITDIFIDSALKICNNDCAAFEGFLKRLEAISDGVNIVITASIAVEECPDAIKAYA